MKKKNVVLYAGVLSMVMLGGCGTSTSNETSTPVTQEVTQDATEAPEVTEAPEAEKATTGNEEKNNSTEVTNEENTSEETEVQEETADTDVDSRTAFSSLMTEIYAVKTDSTSAETVAESLKNYAFSYCEPDASSSYSSVFETMANDWFLAIEETEGKDVRSEFSECFHTVTSTAQKMDETLEYDVAYENVVNGILAAIGE